MSDHSNTKSAAELELEAQAQRAKLESRINEIQARLSPGQLVDELLSYTKGGGGEFLTNLQKTVTGNPLPATLLGVSLAWLIGKPASASSPSTEPSAADRAWDNSINARRGYDVDDTLWDDSYPIATISGASLRRTSYANDDDSGNFVSEFADETGKKYRALSDKAGNRAGHFVDETGARFRGFASSTGEKISSFQDEAGNLLDEAGGWASHTWRKAREKLHDAQDAVRSGAGHMGDRANHLQGQMGEHAQQLNQHIMTAFRDQPLVAGALAFAVGAALASTLPHTKQEDELLGEQADKAKATLGTEASKAYESGKEQVADLYGKATDKAGELYEQAKDGLHASLDSPRQLPH